MTLLLESYRHQPSAGEPMGKSSPKLGSVLLFAFLSTSGISEAGTGSAYRRHAQFERTSSGPIRGVPISKVQTSSEAIHEIRRLSGLTWDELADLFAVSRRSLHHWANGKTLTVRHEQQIRKVLTVLRLHTDGSARNLRAWLVSADSSGLSALDRLKEGAFDTLMRGATPRPINSARPLPLSEEAQKARRAPSPTGLLVANHDRPDIPAKARIARPARAPQMV